MTIKLYRHNEEAYKKVVSLLELNNKAAVIHPTGSGKSFIALKLAEDNPDKIVVWISPSKNIFDTQLENYTKAGGVKPENIVFMTFSKLCMAEDDILEAIWADYIVLDEFHRCGARVWSKGVKRLLDTYSDAKVLGLSATHIRYLDSRRNMAQELFENSVASYMSLGEAIALGILKAPVYVTGIYSYDEELKKYHNWIDTIKSPRKHEAYKYLEKLRRNLDASAGVSEILQKYIKNKDSKFLVFCSNTRHMDQMIQKMKEWVKGIDKRPHIYSISSYNKKSQQDFDDFKKDKSNHLKLLFSIDMLNEGVHISGIDGVILFRPTISPVIYKQQIGRALTVGSDKTPIIIDLINNFEGLCSVDSILSEMHDAKAKYSKFGLEKTIECDHFVVTEESAESEKLFKQIERILESPWNYYYGLAKDYYNAYGDLDVSSTYRTDDGVNLYVWLNKMRRSKRGEINNFHITDEQIALLDEIGMIWESKYDYVWNQRYEEAKRYYEKYGNLNVANSYITESGTKLGLWLEKQRHNKKTSNKRLDSNKILKLNEIGMVWDPQADTEEKYLDAAKEYYSQHGVLDCVGTYVTPDGVNLGGWLNRQQKKRRAGVLSVSVEQALDDMNFIWIDSFSDRWESGYRHAEDYYKHYGNLNPAVDIVSEDGFKLGIWIRNQKQAYRRGHLDEVKVKRLENIGIEWNLKFRWEDFYAIAKAYYEKNGNLNIPNDYKDENGIAIGRWITRQRKNFDGLSDEKKIKLESIGLSMRNNAQLVLDDYVEALKRYYEDHGNINDIPDNYLTNEGRNVAGWLRGKRRDYHKRHISDEMVELLNSMEFAWEKKSQWDIGYEHAKKYYEEHGNIDVPYGYTDESGRYVGRWIYSQRREYRNGSLNMNRIKLLEEIEMIWELPKNRNKKRNSSHHHDAYHL